MNKNKKIVIAGVISVFLIFAILIAIFKDGKVFADDWTTGFVEKVSLVPGTNTFNNKISSDYSFAIKVNKNTTVEMPAGFTSSNCVDEHAALVTASYRNAINDPNKVDPILCKVADKQSLVSDADMSAFLAKGGGTWALYRNIGEYDGKVVSVQMIVRSMSQNEYYAKALGVLSNELGSIEKRPVFAFYNPHNAPGHDIGIYMTAIYDADVQFKFYFDEDIQTGTNGKAIVSDGVVQLKSGASPANVKGYFTLLDVDMGQAVILNNEAKGSSSRSLSTFDKLYLFKPATENNAIVNRPQNGTTDPYACSGITKHFSNNTSETCPHILANVNVPGKFYSSEYNMETGTDLDYLGMVSATFGKGNGTSSFYIDYISSDYTVDQLYDLNRNFNNRPTGEPTYMNISSSNFTSGFWFGTPVLGYFELTPPTKLVNNKKSANIKAGDTFTYKINQTIPWAGELKYNSFVMTDVLDSNIDAPSASSITIKNEDGDTKTQLFDISVVGQTITITAKSSSLSSNEFYDHTYTIIFNSKVKNNDTVNQAFVNNGKYVFKNKVSTKISRNIAGVPEEPEKTSNEVTVTVTKPVNVKYHIVGDHPSDTPSAPGDESKNAGDAYSTQAKLNNGIYSGKKCVFDGWHTVNNNGNLSGAWTNGTKLADDLNLYGKWTCYDPVEVKYHIVGNIKPPINLTSYSNNTAVDLNQNGAPSESGTFYVNDSYTAKPTLKTSWKNQKCTFAGWTTNSNATGNAYTTGVLTGNLDLYGKWDCINLIPDPEKKVNKSEVLAEEEFEYTITHTVPAIDDSYYYYDKYILTDELEPVFTVGKVSIFTSTGENVKDKFNINIIGNKVEIKPLSLSDASFYGKTYNFKIVANLDSAHYAELEQYVNYEIPNKAVLKINDVTKETIAKIKTKKVNIKYHLIGDPNDRPDASKTSPVPGDEERYSGSKYTQKGPLTTTDVSKKCTFNGWYLDKNLTKKWRNNDYLVSDLDFYGKWQCDQIVNEINKTTTEDKIVGTKEYDYVIYQNVPELTSEYYYKSYQIIDELEPVLQIEDSSKVKVLAGGQDVTNKFDVIIDGNKVTIKAKDTSKADFYNKNYEYVLTVHKRKNADLSPYKVGDRFVIPNKAKLKVKLADDSTPEKNTPDVLKEVKQVKVNYQVIGNVKPDPNLTDPTPGDATIISGSLYKAENPLTTRYTEKQCTFSGWYSDTSLKTIFNEAELDEDLTLYGTWNCTDIVRVPKTDASVSGVVLGIGSVLSIGAAVGVYLVVKKNNMKKE